MAEKPMRISQLPREELMVSGTRGCPGCSGAIMMRQAMKVFGKYTIVSIPATCLLVVTNCAMNAWKVPLIHVAFENTAAVLTGVAAARRILERKGKLKEKKRVNYVGFAGDGGTADIGMQALSGAAERNDDMIYICYDNEAYMNTGIQRSGATPYGAWTTTTPIGRIKKVGKTERKKDVPMIMAAHKVPYIATVSLAHTQDYLRKLRKATKIEGFRYIHVLGPCPTGWGFDPSKTIEISKLAVETGIWLVYEIENGVFKLTVKPKHRKPVEEYLKAQRRFRHLTAEQIGMIQRYVDQECGKLGF